MLVAPGSVRRDVSAIQAKKSVESDDSLLKMGLKLRKVKDRPGFALDEAWIHPSMESGKVTETRVPLPTSLSMSSCP